MSKRKRNTFNKPTIIWDATKFEIKYHKKRKRHLVKQELKSLTNKK